MKFVENPRLRRRLLSTVGRAWKRGEPLSMRPTDGDRFVARVIARGRIGVAIAVENELFAALRAKEIREEVIARKPPTFGLRLAGQPAKTGEDRAKTSPMRLRPSSPGKAKALRQLPNLKGEDVGEDRAKTLGRPRKSLKRLARTCGEDTLSYSLSKIKRRRAGSAPRAAVFRDGCELPLNTPFAVGDVCLDRGQRFVCFEIVPCIRQDETPSAYSLWRSACAECAAPFVHHGGTATLTIQRRRCPAHRSPGRRTRFAPAPGKSRRKRREAVR